MKILLVDLNSVLFPIWHMSGNESDVDHTSRATVARVRSLATGYDHAAICCDSPTSVRKQISPEYKANRPERDERIVHQIRLAQETLAKDGFPIWRVDGYEADDVIATAVARSAELDPTPGIVIASSDKDLLQLVDVRVSALSLKSGALLGPAEVAAKYVPPHQMRDYLILVGDQSDGVRGVPGIGDKRAKDLLGKHGSLLAIYEKIAQGKAALEGMTPALVTALQESIGVVELGRRLVSMYDNLPIPFDEVLAPRVLQPLAPSPANDDFDDDVKALEEEETVGTQIVNMDTGEVTSSREPTGQLPSEPIARTEAVVVSDASSPQDNALVAPVSWDLALEPRNPGQAVALAARLFNSRMFAGYGNPESVLSTILLGRELGIGAMGSLRGVHNIKGKHALAADLMAALVLRSGKAKYFAPVKLSATSATYKTHRIGSPDPFELTFDFSEAVTAGLVKDDSGWKKWPLDMCKARAVGRLARTIYPDICFGLYVTEELEDVREAA